jgi:hypothetical protein
MRLEQLTILRARAWAILLIAAAAAIWWGLDRAEPRAEWLRVEAPRQAVYGQPLRVRVQLAPLANPGVLYADLHWGASRDQPMHYLAAGSSKAVGKEGGTFDFEIMVAPRAGLRFVMGVIYVSRTGGWQGHDLAASTKLIPVVNTTASTAETRLEPLATQPLRRLDPAHPPLAPLPRVLTGLLFLAALMAVCRPTQPTSEAKSGPGAGVLWWRLLVVALALACLTELLGLESWAGAQARALARTADFYYPRAVFQKVAISVASAAALLAVLLIQRAPKCYRLLLTSLTLYLAISAVNLVSLHAIDKVAALSWHGLSVVQALKLACAAMIWQGVRQAKCFAQTGQSVASSPVGGLRR